MLTAKDIRNKRFEKAAFGYKQEEIDEFLQELENDLKTMEHDLEDANNKIQLLADKVREYRADEEALKDALLGAQKQGKLVIAEANEKAEEILKEARDKADELTDEAVRQHAEAMEKNRLEIEREHQALVIAQNQVADFKKQLFDMYKTHLDLISQMPEPEEYDNTYTDSYEEEDYEEDIADDTPVLDDPQEEERDPFATSQFSAKTIRGEFDQRYGDLQFGKNNEDNN
ncbi:MAG: DivIVA domain-containing protein [Ruminococcus sp.]|nr:DivIVA domain-containing protein [Ruminococcus sp.]MBQ8906893.1 DivIVA domain-containing protein [Ruminococcus sp.]